MIAYYHEIMNQSTANLEMPDLTLLARDHHQQEWLKIVILTLGIAVQCPNKSMFIEKIQELSDNAQVDLMHIIEDILSKTVSIDPDQKKQPTCLMEYNSPVPSPVTEKLWNIEGKKLQLDRLSKEVKSLQEENSTLLDENQRLVNEKDCLQDSVDKLNLKISKLNKKIEELAEQPSTNDQDLNVVTTDSRLLQENRHQKELIKSLEEQLMVSVEQNEKLESRASNFNEMKKTLEVMKLKMTEMTTAMEFEISQKEDVERKLESSVKLFAALQEESRQDKAKVSQLQDLLKEAHQNENDGGWYSTINLEEDVSGQNEIQESLQKANNVRLLIFTSFSIDHQRSRTENQRFDISRHKHRFQRSSKIPNNNAGTTRSRNCQVVGRVENYKGSSTKRAKIDYICMVRVGFTIPTSSSI